MFGHEAGQYHVLGPDPWSVIWSADGTGFMAFLEERHCVFGWRSPVAPAGHELELMGALGRYARQRRKPLITVLVNDATCAAGVQIGMTPIWIGSETFHDLGSWTIRGGRREKLRLARNHARRLGYSWREAFPHASSQDRQQLDAVEAEWKAARRQRATDSFQRTSFAELSELRRYFVCEGPATPEGPGQMVAFMACTPVRADGWYLQDPVRSDAAPRGALEGCIVAALDGLRDDGYAFASNGPLPFWRPDGEPVDDHQLGPLGQRVVHFFDRQYRFRGISQFRTKLDPDRVIPLYVLMSRRVLTPAAARSVVRVLTKRLA